jgi:hypothetical protein
MASYLLLRAGVTESKEEQAATAMHLSQQSYDIDGPGKYHAQ